MQNNRDPFYLIVAFDQQQGIGKDNSIPWARLKGDMKFYRDITTCSRLEDIERCYGMESHAEDRNFSSYQKLIDHIKTKKTSQSSYKKEETNAVIMGRKTWESLPDSFRPLPHRVNVVLTKNSSFVAKGAVKASSFDHAFAQLEVQSIRYIFVIGGGMVFQEAISRQECKKLFITQISSCLPCDTFFPEYEHLFDHSCGAYTVQERTYSYRFTSSRRKNLYRK